MIIVKHAIDVEKYLLPLVSAGKAIGFVPTMGALHAGHISLIQACAAENDWCVSSIFVNPTQFNNAADFEKYPVTIEKDIDMLEAAGCHLLFLPNVSDIYPAGFSTPHYDLGYLETILDGRFRPGHFQGVCQVVDILLQIVRPGRLYLGQKDYQQCMVIKKMIDLKKHATDIRILPTVREADGLAMSSRNMRLSAQERQQSLAISQVLFYIRQHIQPGNLVTIKKEMADRLTRLGYKVDYVEVADAATLQLLDEWDGKTKIVALVAAFLNEVRLIDNMLLN